MRVKPTPKDVDCCIARLFVENVSRSRVEPLSRLLSLSKCVLHVVLVDRLFETVTGSRDRLVAVAPGDRNERRSQFAVPRLPFRFAFVAGQCGS